MKLKTLTPVHIGNGESLKPLSYIVDGHVLTVLHMSKFFRLLTPLQRDYYMQWINQILRDAAQIEEEIAQTKRAGKHNPELFRQKSFEEGKLSLGWFIENKLRQDPAHFAQKCSAYQIDCTCRLRRDGFKTHLKDIQKRPYIPGSEIKGALRTSILHDMLQEDQEYKMLQSAYLELKSTLNSKELDFKEKKKQFKKMAGPQEEKGLERNLLRGKEKDAKCDLLKFVTIGDTCAKESGCLKIELTKALGTRRNTKMWLEAIKPDTKFQFQLSTLNNFSLDVLKLKEKEDWLSEGRILRACFQRAKDLLQEEKKYFSGNSQILGEIDRLERENQPSAPLLRLGAGQGFLGTTINLKMLLDDSQLYEETIPCGVKLLKPRVNINPEKFPKTRRIAIDAQENPVTLLGWVKIEAG